MKYLLILSLLLFVGCSTVELCNDPYIEYKTGECCLDDNSNSICDGDEAVQEIVEKVINPIINQEKKEYDLQKARQVALTEANEYLRINNIGVSRAFTYKSDFLQEEIYTIYYTVKYLVNMDESREGTVRVNYDLDKEKVISVKYLG